MFASATIIFRGRKEKGGIATACSPYLVRRRFGSIAITVACFLRLDFVHVVARCRHDTIIPTPITSPQIPPIDRIYPSETFDERSKSNQTLSQRLHSRQTQRASSASHNRAQSISYLPISHTMAPKSITGFDPAAFSRAAGPVSGDPWARRFVVITYFPP